MNYYKLNLLKKEFPFLNQVSEELGIDAKTVDFINIKRGDRTLLRKTGNVDSYQFCNGGSYDYTIYFAITDDAIIKLSNNESYQYASGDHKEFDAQPIEEQLFLMNINPTFLVECIQKDTDGNGNGRERREWTIFKVSKFDMSLHHKENIDREAAILKKELEAWL